MKKRVPPISTQTAGSPFNKRKCSHGGVLTRALTKPSTWTKREGVCGPLLLNVLESGNNAVNNYLSLVVAAVNVGINVNSTSLDKC